MAETVRRLKINRRYESSACAWCADALALGEEGAMCEACESPHHARCWDKENGCGQAGCVNAPLRQIVTDAVYEESFYEEQVYEEDLATKHMGCSYCRRPLPVGSIVCPGCLQIITPVPLVEVGQKTNPTSRNAFLFGLAALIAPLTTIVMLSAINGYAAGFIAFVVEIQCVWSAITKGRDAKTQIANNQNLKGAGLATAGQVLGGVALALYILLLVGSVLLYQFVTMRAGVPRAR